MLIFKERTWCHKYVNFVFLVPSRNPVTCFYNLSPEQKIHKAFVLFRVSRTFNLFRKLNTSRPQVIPRAGDPSFAPKRDTALGFYLIFFIDPHKPPSPISLLSHNHTLSKSPSLPQSPPTPLESAPKKATLHRFPHTLL